MPFIRTASTSRLPSERWLFDTVVEESWTLNNNVTEHPIEGGASTFEYAADHIQAEPEEFTVEVVILESRMSRNVPVDASEPGVEQSINVPRLQRGRRFHEWIRANRQRLWYYSSVRFGVVGPLALKSSTEPVTLRGDLRATLTFKRIFVGTSTTVTLPPSVPKRAKKKDDKGDQTKVPPSAGILLTSWLSRTFGLNQGVGAVTPSADVAGVQVVRGLKGAQVIPIAPGKALMLAPGQNGIVLDNITAAAQLGKKGSDIPIAPPPALPTITPAQAGDLLDLLPGAQ